MPSTARRTTRTTRPTASAPTSTPSSRDGLVLDNIIECPKHNGRFDYRTGQAKGAPVCVNLKTYPVKVEGGKVLIAVG